MSSQSVQTYDTEVEDLVVEANVVIRYQCSFTCNELMQRHISVAILLLQCQTAECFLTPNTTCKECYQMEEKILLDR